MSVSNGLSIGHIGLQWGMSGLDGSLMKHVKVFDGSPIRLAGLRWASDRFTMGLQLGMLVSDGSLIRHVCLSLIRHVGLRPIMSVSDGCPMKHVEVSEQASRSPIGLR